jgi:hypothetical protein
MPNRTIDQDDILSLIATADDYGHHNSVCMGALVEWAWPITDEDIERYASDFLTDEMKAQGYGQDDYDSVKERLEEARTRYKTAT